MMSQIRSYIEYFTLTYSTLVLLLHSNLMKNP